MIAKAMQKGLGETVAGADLDACAAQVNFAQDVGKLNTHQPEFAKLSRTNACTNGVISFFNGQTWNIPAGAKPPSKSYTRTKFTPQFDPSTGNFDFCSAPLAPALEPEGCFKFFHEGHCATGWMNHNTLKKTIGECEAECRSRAGCGFFAFAAGERSTKTNCAVYSLAGGCGDDTNFPGYKAYSLNPKC